MRLRWLLILCFVLLLCGYPAHAAKRGDLPTSSGGQADSCDSGTLFYLSLSPVVQLNVLTVQDTNGNSYTVHVDGYDWGELVGCPADHTAPPPGTVLTEDRSAGAHSIFFVYVLGSDGKPVSQLSLNSLEISLILANPGFVLCNGTDMPLCNLPPSGHPVTIPPPDLLQPASSPSADGTGTTWSFGPVYDATNQTVIPLNSNYNGHWVTFNGTNPTTYIIGYGTAVLVADGTVQCDSPPAGPCNGVSSSTPFSIAFTPPGSSSVIKASSPSFPVETAAMSAAGHDVESNPIVLSPTSETSVLDTVSNYPQQIISSTTPPTETVVNGPATPTFLCPTLQSTSLQAYRSVWFQFTSPVSTEVYLSTAGSHYDTIMSIAENSDCNDDSDPNDIGVVTSQIPSPLISTGPQGFVASANTPYHILVTEFPPNSQQQDGSSSDGDASYTASLSGDSTLYFTLATPQLNATPASLKDFGSFTIGKRTTPQTIDLASNTFHFGGTGITNITAAASGDFQVTPTTCTSPLPDSGPPCSLNVTFTPTAAGERTGSLTITSSGVTAAENTPIVIALGGTGVPPEPAVALAPATSLTFPSQTVATHSIVSDVVVTNTGTGSLTISNIAITGDFSQTNNCTMAQVAVSGSCTVMVTFSPTTSGTRTGTLKITDNAPNSPQQITLLGVGVGTPIINWSTPAAITYPASLSKTQLDATASFGGVTVPGTFVYSPTLGTVLSPGTTTLSVTFTPTDSTDYTTAKGSVSLIVNKGMQTITFNPLSNVTYGASPSTLTGTASSRLPVTYTVTGPANLSGSKLTITGVGTVTVMAYQAGNADYAAAPSAKQSFSVARATLTIAANNATAVYAQTIPPFTYTATGFVNSDTKTILSGAPSETTTAKQGSLVGTYPITVSQGTLAAANYSFNFVNGMLTITSVAGALQFIPVTPCRIADTRNPDGPFGGPELAAGAIRTFDIPQSNCGIPTTATAYSLNVTVVPNAALGFLTIWPAGEAQPVASTLNSDGRVKANAAITPAGTNGGVSVFVSDATQFILDIDGYFLPAGTNISGLEFYPLPPCRITDTRNATGQLGGPSLTGGGAGRAFPVQSSPCGIPSTAKAYSLNITAVPHGSLGYLTTWPTGQAQPVVSTLNSSTGAVTANAAIVPAGSGGDISVFVSDTADVILDVNGYFAAPATGGLALYTLTPCRVLDTRNGSGAFNGTLVAPISTSACAPPATAQAYVLNATVVPSGSLGYLTLWPDSSAQPLVSTLNAGDGAVTSNMAVIQTKNGSVDAFATSSTNLILDISSYFAP
jgi:hypothetical protein